MECAAHFGMNAGRWVLVCQWIWQFSMVSAPIRFDSSQRIARAEHYREAIQQLEEGISPEMVQLPGIGTCALPAQAHTVTTPVP